MEEKQKVNPRDLMTIDDAVKYLGISERTLSAYMSTGRIKSAVLCGVRLPYRKSVEEYKKRRDEWERRKRAKGDSSESEPENDVGLENEAPESEHEPNQGVGDGEITENLGEPSNDEKEEEEQAMERETQSKDAEVEALKAKVIELSSQLENLSRQQENFQRQVSEVIQTIPDILNKVVMDHVAKSVPSAGSVQQPQSPPPTSGSMEGDVEGIDGQEDGGAQGVSAGNIPDAVKYDLIIKQADLEFSEKLKNMGHLEKMILLSRNLQGAVGLLSALKGSGGEGGGGGGASAISEVVNQLAGAFNLMQNVFQMATKTVAEAQKMTMGIQASAIESAVERALKKAISKGTAGRGESEGEQGEE